MCSLSGGDGSNGCRLCVALLIAGCSFAITACGSSKPSGTAKAAGQFAQAVKYSDCMRSHGLSNFPDPTAGGGLNMQAVGTEASSPTFVSAQKACAKLQPGGSGPPRLTGAQLFQMAAKARCIRRHGFPGIPDPTLVPGGEGVVDNLPSGWNPEAPASVLARKACAHVGIPIPGWGVAWFGPVT